MFGYYLSQAFISIKKTPILSALMVLAIAVGIGSCLTMLTIYDVKTQNPLESKNDQVFAIQLNTWGDKEGHWSKNGSPTLLTYNDAKALYDTGIADKLAIHFNTGLSFSSLTPSVKPGVEEVRMVTRDFFSIFDVHFTKGNPWSKKQDRIGEPVIVLTESLAARYELGPNPIGKTLILEGQEYTVAGLASDHWNLTPSLYDLHWNPFKEAPKAYIPLFMTEHKQFPIWGNMEGWKHQDIANYTDFLNSEVVWLFAWAGFNTLENKNSFETFLKNYINEQNHQGRFPISQAFHLQTPEQWMSLFNVVSKEDRLLLMMAFAFLTVCLINSMVLLFAKFARQTSTVAIRRALGASQNSILLQHLIESLLIASLGALMGILLAWLGLIGVRHLYSDYSSMTSIDLSTYFYATILAISAGLISGLIPALKISSTVIAPHLKTE